MRDLKADLEICNKATVGPWEYVSETTYVEDYPFSTADRVKIGNETLTVYCCAPDFDGGKKYKADAQFIAAAREGWPHAILRATKAEAEAERLRLMVKTITGGLDEAIEAVHFLETENALLRKVAKAARSVAGFGPCHDANSYWSIKELSNALDEYDKAKEGQ